MVTDETPPEYIYEGDISDIYIDNEIRKVYLFPEGWECREYAYGAKDCSSFHIPIQKNNKWFLLQGIGQAKEIGDDYKLILSIFKFLK